MSYISCPLQWQSEMKKLNSCQVTTNHSCGNENPLTHIPLISSLSSVLFFVFAYFSFAKHMRMKISNSFHDGDMELILLSLISLLPFYYGLLSLRHSWLNIFI